MNGFERAICAAVRRALDRYEAITGNWLFHAPEHFLQNFLLLDLGKERGVYAEATRRKISHGLGRPPRGRPPKARTARTDLVAWHKDRRRGLRAAIEVKRSWSCDAQLRRDADRIKKASAKGMAGYLVVYSEMPKNGGRNRPKDLRLRFSRWASRMGLRSLRSATMGYDDDWIAGYALMRVRSR